MTNKYDFMYALIQPYCSLINLVFYTQALQVLAGLVEARTLPVSRYIEVTELTQGRLYDKLSNVRKYAMQLMITLISHNPYGAKVSVVYNQRLVFQPQLFGMCACSKF